jgi:D-lactate dehydrogenase
MPNVAVFSTKPYDQRFLEQANASNGHDHTLSFFEARLTQDTAPLAEGCDAVCAFVNDQLNEQTIQRLARGGVTLIALRCAGFNQVDLAAAQNHGLTVARVPAYSPHAVAEHTLALILALNRRIHRAYNRVREGNFAIDGLLGFDMHGKTAGVIGTGRIGQIVVGILRGLGCRVLAYDPYPNQATRDAGADYTSLTDLYAQSEVITLHCPLTPDTYHLIDEPALSSMKTGAMLINTSRGGLVDARAVIDALKTGALGAVGLDVYEEEADVFFENLSDQVIQDDVLARLMTFPNVLITSHQAFFTEEAMHNIAETTLRNVTAHQHNAIPEANRVSLSARA